MLKVLYKIFLWYKLYTAIFLVVFRLHFSSSTDRKGLIQDNTTEEGHDGQTNRLRAVTKLTQ